MKKGRMDVDSILTSIKKLLLLAEDDTSFDADIIMHINSVISILSQLGIPSADKFAVTGKEETWAQLIGSYPNLDLVRSYVYLKVKLLFDPGTSSAVIESTNRVASELEWRIYATAEAIRRNVQASG